MNSTVRNAFSILDDLQDSNRLSPQVHAEPEQDLKEESVKTLKDEFNEIVRDGIKRTGFKRDRIESFIPKELLSLYRNVNRPAGKLLDDKQGLELFRFVRDDIFGALPDYTSPATPSQSNGFFINGKKAVISMSREVASRQIAIARENLGNTFVIACENQLKRDFSPKEIKDTIYGTGASSLNRQLVANIIRIAEEMKSIPK